MRRAVAVVFLLSLVACVEASTVTSIFRIEWQIQIKNPGSTEAKDVRAFVLIFDNREGWINQLILDENLPATRVDRTADNRVAVFEISRLRPGEVRTYTLTQLIRIDRTELNLSGASNSPIPESLKPLTRPIDFLWENAPELIEAARQATENCDTWISKVEKIFEFVKSYLTYQKQTEEHSALWAYHNRVGDCTEFTNLFIALCRLSGIPAKFVSAIGYEADGELYSMGHAYALVYLPGLEWVPVDLTWSAPAGELGTSSEDKLALLVSDGTNLLRDSTIWTPRDRIVYSYVGSDPRVQLSSCATITKEVGAQVDLDASALLEEGNVWKWYVTVRNKGKCPMQNLRVKLQADNRFFEAPPEQTYSSLGPGHNRTFTFELKVRETAENVPVRAVVEYDTVYGSFQAVGESVASVYIPSPPLRGFFDQLYKFLEVVLREIKGRPPYLLLVALAVVLVLAFRRF